jgi:hypothetical protein
MLSRPDLGVGLGDVLRQLWREDKLVEALGGGGGGGRGQHLEVAVPEESDVGAHVGQLAAGVVHAKEEALAAVPDQRQALGQAAHGSAESNSKRVELSLMCASMFIREIFYIVSLFTEQ